MPKKTNDYIIKLIGCDGETVIKIGLTEQEKMLLDRIAVIFSCKSSCECEPIMRIKKCPTKQNL